MLCVPLLRTNLSLLSAPPICDESAISQKQIELYTTHAEVATTSSIVTTESGCVLPLSPIAVHSALDFTATKSSADSDSELIEDRTLSRLKKQHNLFMSEGKGDNQLILEET